MTKEARIYNEESSVSSVNDVGKDGQPSIKGWNWTTALYCTQKINSEWIKATT